MHPSDCCSQKIQVYKYGHLGASNYNLTTWGVHNKKMHILNFDILIQKKKNYIFLRNMYGFYSRVQKNSFNKCHD